VWSNHTGGLRGDAATGQVLDFFLGDPIEFK